MRRGREDSQYWVRGAGDCKGRMGLTPGPLRNGRTCLRVILLIGEEAEVCILHSLTGKHWLEAALWGTASPASTNQNGQGGEGAKGYSRSCPSTRSFSLSLIHFLIKHVPNAYSGPGTELATGDSELNKTRSLPRRGSQVNGV